MVVKRPMVAFLVSCCSLSGPDSRGELGLKPRICSYANNWWFYGASPRSARTVEHRSLAVGMAGSTVPTLLDAIIIVQPETVIAGTDAGFRAYWRWKSCVWRIADLCRKSAICRTGRLR